MSADCQRVFYTYPGRGPIGRIHRRSGLGLLDFSVRGSQSLRFFENPEGAEARPIKAGRNDLAVLKGSKRETFAMAS